MRRLASPLLVAFLLVISIPTGARAQIRYLGSVALVSFDFAPKGWALCNGQLLPINQNQALFALLGTTYRGNGQTTFALPDLQGRMPVGAGQGDGLSPYAIGQTGGEGVFTFIGASMLVVVFSIGIFGPLTRNLALEVISH